MKNRRGFSLLVRFALVAVCALPVAGCDSIADLMFGENYEGPPPAEEDITNEVAVVRSTVVAESGLIVLLVDRVRYVDAGDPHNVNRVVQVYSGDAMRETVAALNLSAGESVLISTEYQSYTNVMGIRSVPNWPGHNAYEYPIAIHGVTAIARTGS
ncbi:MAG TPA: hypothetical protein VLK84_30995 [Longimicrobium sp.]|nr:hypothetical protein [Longimicrobium sp.]